MTTKFIIPTVNQIKELQGDRTGAECADAVKVSPAAWSRWTSGDRPMNATAWELFLIKSRKKGVSND